MAERTGIRFSVIVPVYRQWHLVQDLIAAIESQTFPSEHIEVIFVDNGTPDFEPASSLPPHARTLICDKPGSYAARDHGARDARGDYLAFTDADCRPIPRWLSAYDRAARGGGKLFGGPVDTLASATPNAFEVHSQVRGIPQHSYVERGYAATANLCVEAGLYRQLSGFNRDLLSGGDADFCWRARAAGHSVRLVAEARVNHLARRGLREVATKARRLAGARLTSGSFSRRVRGALAILAPPIVAWRQEMLTPDTPLKDRLIAAGVEALIWAVQIGEFLRLACGFPPERR